MTASASTNGSICAPLKDSEEPEQSTHEGASKKMGRPSKLNPTIQAEVCKHIENCLHYKDAALLSGISYVTFNEWMKKGREQKRGRYHDFLVAVENAEAKANDTLLAIVREEAERGTEKVRTETTFDASGNVVSKKEIKERSP